MTAIHVIQVLCNVPLRIHLLSAENKMGAHNLSVVFAPTLMRSPDENTSLIRDLALQRDFIEYLIVYNDILFR